jgi:hypothetical protein
MNKHFVAGVLTLACVLSPSASATSIEPALVCSTGPITKTFGRTQWWVSSCDDEMSISVMAAPGNPARPYVFLLSPKDGRYGVQGDGPRRDANVEAAQLELASLTAQDVLSIIAETKAHSTSAGTGPSPN